MELVCLLSNGVVALNTLKGLRQVGEVNLDPNLTGIVPPRTLDREGRDRGWEGEGRDRGWEGEGRGGEGEGGSID